MSSVPAIVERIESREQRLADCERRIEAGRIEQGHGLRAVRDDRLYREAGFNDFDTYCRERWGYNRDYVDKLIRAADVRANLHTNGMEVLPASERQTRPLSRLGPDQQVEAWSRAVETAGESRITARHVEAAVEELFPKRSEVDPDPDAFEDNPSLAVPPARPSLPGQAALPLGPKAEPARHREEIIDVEFGAVPAPEDEPDRGGADDYSLEPAAPPAPAVNPAKSLERWSKFIEDMNLFLVSLPRRGGIARLMDKWPTDRRRAFVDYLKEFRDSIDKAIRESEEVLR